MTKNRYLQCFFCTVAVLAVARCVFPGIAEPNTGWGVADGKLQRDTFSSTGVPGANAADTLIAGIASGRGAAVSGVSKFFHADGTLVKNRIYSVRSFRDVFPDNNDIQMSAAKRYGVSPVQNRLEAESRKKELVYIGSNPFFHVDKLNSSIPYLVPKAAVLLQDIGKSFFDSLQIKGIPLHKIIVTSVLRTKDDVKKLRTRNGNATENSCHLYGTTFDICYNRYVTVENPDGPARRKVRNDSLKWVLSEVLSDYRQSGRCLIKYEVKQGCFHMTVN